MTTWLFVEPLDVLYLRGNEAFGGPGEHAEALMPPWPSVFSGAIRSALLARAGVDLGRFTDEAAEHAHAEYAQVLGTPSEPGSFRLVHVSLARRASSGKFEALLPMPADVVVLDHSKARVRVRCGPDGEPRVKNEARRLRLVPKGDGQLPLAHSGELPALPLLAAKEQTKPSSGWWLTQAGWQEYWEGTAPDPAHCVRARELWDTDFRLGIARDRETFTVAKGRIYTTQAVALQPGVGFLLGVQGCPAELLQGVDTLRLGGDGRGAHMELLPGDPTQSRKLGENEPFLLFLLTSGLFPGGWLPPGVRKNGSGYRLVCDGLQARLAAAVVPKPQVVSGWDLAAHRPKPAQRAVPAGAVYCFDEVNGDPARYLEQVWELAQAELVQRQGPDVWDSVWKQRKAEGFNNFLLGRWPSEDK